MGTNAIGCTEWERDYDPITEQPKEHRNMIVPPHKEHPRPTSSHPQLHNAPLRTDLFDGTLNGYQLAAQTTAIYPGKGTFWGLVYASLKGSGEVGEFNEKVGKLLRDSNAQPTDVTTQLPIETLDTLTLELGDELWYLAAKANELGVTLGEVALRNLQKLKDRQDRGTLSGSGDTR